MKTIAEIKAEFAAADMSSYPALYEIYKEDTRSGVQKLIAQCRKKEAALEAEKQRIENMKVYEHKYEHLGYLCGIDEVGRGPLAGPVVACFLCIGKCFDMNIRFVLFYFRCDLNSVTSEVI